MARKYHSYNQTHRIDKGVKQKLCVKCERWLGYGEFLKDRSRKDGLRRLCIECERAYDRKRYRKNRKHVRKHLRYKDRHRVVHGVKQKLCCHCEKWNDESQFPKNRNSQDGLHWRCKECLNECARKRYVQAKDTRKRNLRYEDRHRIVDGVKKKFCRMCRRWKAESEFNKNRCKKDGLSERCKKCSCWVSKEYYRRRLSVKN
jgi:hypothetical protein